MDQMKFRHIKNEYDQFYQAMMQEGQLPFRSTNRGFWGHAAPEDVFEAFKRLRLDRYNSFIDLGSGDGKVVLIASLFCKRAVGIESDPHLHLSALAMQRILGRPNALFYNDDFHNQSVLPFDVVFVNPDKPMHRGLEEKLRRELRGMLVHHGNHFHPEQLHLAGRFSVNATNFSMYVNKRP